MNENTWKPTWIRGSRIEEIVWVGKEVLAWCSGLCIVFFHATEKRQSLRWCAGQSSGEGACCLSGHAGVPVFAFSEKAAHPRILVFAYPSMTKISECAQGSPAGYLTTAFTAQEHMVSLGSYPDFQLIVWSWRTGEKIATVDTAIRDREGQILRVTQSGPTYLAQLAKSAGKLITWELDVLEKLVIFKDHRVKLPENARPLWIDWRPGPEALLAICDQHGHVYLSSHDGSDIKRVVFSQRCGICLEYELPRICWFRGGIVLKTTFCQVRFYRKNRKTSQWNMAWYIKCSRRPCLLIAHPSKSDRLFYQTLEGYLMQIDFPEEQDTPNVQRHMYYGAVYKLVEFVYPSCHFLVAMDEFRELIVLERYGGREISRFAPDTKGRVNSLLCHPEQPLVALLTTAGELVLVALIHPQEPSVLARVHLHGAPLDLIRFSSRGKYLLAAERSSGVCFCLNALQGKALRVLAEIRTRKVIADAVPLEAGISLKVIVLCASVKQISSGQQLLAYDVTGEQTLIGEHASTVRLHTFFRNIHQAPGTGNIFIGSPSLTRQLHTFKLPEQKSVIIANALASGHHVRGASVFVNQNWVATAAMDGFVIIRDRKLKKLLNPMMTHHRKDLGVLKAIVDTNGENLVALGHNGSLVALSKFSKEEEGISHMYRVDREMYTSMSERIRMECDSLDENIKGLLSMKKQKFAAPEKEDDGTWTEWRQRRMLENLDQQCSKEKQSIRQEFFALQSALRDLLNANELCPEIEKLPISTFDLDQALRENRIQRAKEEAEELRVKLEDECARMDQLSHWVKTRYWDPLIVLGQSIFQIFDTMEVGNYPVVADDTRADDTLMWAQFNKESSRKILEKGILEAWRPQSESKLEMELLMPNRLRQEDERQRMDDLLEEEELEVVYGGELEEERACSGMTTHLYVEPCPGYYSQLESYGFTHVLYNNLFLLEDGKKLRAYFNKLFNDMLTMKKRDVDALYEMNRKLEHISSELKTMFAISIEKSAPADYQWHWRERPEGIPEVLDTEVKAKPYVSPSRQAILDEEAAEAERIRQLLLADDFRERTLMAMMDGVLEVRWEDIIKRDVPKPECMLRKKPEEYNAEDIAVVKKYRKDVETLNEERERYKRILKSDYAKTWALRQEHIEKFNLRMNDFSLEKIKMEAALNQLNLRYVRGLLRNLKRVQAMRKDVAIKESMREKQDHMMIIEDHLLEMEKFRQSAHSRYEGLLNYEKNLSRKMRVEFQSFGKVVVNYLEHLYGRRPRMTLKLSASDLIDLGQHVVSQSKPVHLPAVCAEYLRHLENLDALPTNLPEAIGATQWTVFCQLRRQKIEFELRIRAHATEIIEAERKINNAREKMERLRESVEGLRGQLRENRENRENFDRNIEIQLVLKMGQIEVPLRGRLDDAAHAVFVPRSAVDDVNRLILAAGNRKINTMNRIVQFRRGILFKEWKHESLQLELRFLKEELEEVKRIKVTIEIRKFLRSRIAKDRKSKKSDAEKMLQEHERAIQKEERALKNFQEEFRKSLNLEIAKLVSIEAKIASMKKKNALLDRLVEESNVVRSEMEHQRDIAREEGERKFEGRRMKIFLQRSSLVRKIQANYIELLSLHAEHNLLRLRRSPGCFRLPEDLRQKRK